MRSRGKSSDPTTSEHKVTNKLLKPALRLRQSSNGDWQCFLQQTKVHTTQKIR